MLLSVAQLEKAGKSVPWPVRREQARKWVEDYWRKWRQELPARLQKDEEARLAAGRRLLEKTRPLLKNFPRDGMLKVLDKVFTPAQIASVPLEPGAVDTYVPVCRSCRRVLPNAWRRKACCQNPDPAVLVPVKFLG